MLICILYQHFTDRKDEEFDFDECYSLVRFRSKRTEEVRKVFKTNVLVPKITVLKKQRAPLPRRLTYLLRGETVRAGLARAERAAILHRDLTLQETPIKYR